MNWFGGVMNGNNTAFELQTEFASADTTQVLATDSGGGGGFSGDHIYIDWGDGSGIERYSDVVTQGVAVHHTYAGTGPYRIRTWQQDFDINNPDNDFAWINLYVQQGTNTWQGIRTNPTPKIISFGLIMYDARGNKSGIQFGNTRRTVGWDMSYLQNYPIISSTSNRNLESFFNGGSKNIELASWKDPYGNNKKLYWFDNPVFSPTSLEDSFRGQETFNCYVGGWDVSNCTNMLGLFRETAFNNDGVDDLDNWNVSSVTNMVSMFLNASSFNQDIGSWNVSSVTTMTNMFRGSSSFNQDIGSWDVSNVGSFSQTFRSSSFNHDLSSWSFASAISLQRMLQSASSFNQDISAWGANDGGMSTGAGPFSNMLDSTAMSVENYSKWLICLANWAYDNSHTSSEILGASGLQYNNTTYGGIGSGQYTDAVTARAYLVSTLGWTVTDSGQA